MPHAVVDDFLPNATIGSLLAKLRAVLCGLSSQPVNLDRCKEQVGRAIRTLLNEQIVGLTLSPERDLALALTLQPLLPGADVIIDPLPDKAQELNFLCYIYDGPLVVSGLSARLGVDSRECLVKPRNNRAVFPGPKVRLSLALDPSANTAQDVFVLVGNLR